MSPGILITATGTDVGKTMLTSGLLRLYLRNGIDAIPMKPVQTGARCNSGGRLIAPDVEAVCQAAGLEIDPAEMEQVCPYRFEPSCSPHLAGQMAGVEICLQRITECAHSLAQRHQAVVVETAGGIMVPLNQKELTIDLAEALGYPVILLGHSGLGTLNHLLLSLEVLRARKLDVLGIILNDRWPIVQTQRYIHEDNVRAIERFGRAKVLAHIPYLEEPPDFSRLDQSLAGLTSTLI